MDTYRRRPPAAIPGAHVPDARQALETAGDFLRRLIPLPGADMLASPMSLLPRGAQEGAERSSPAATAVQDVLGHQAASLVSQAASILDEEMAKGVLAAQHSSGVRPYGTSDAANPALRQVHDLVDNLAAIWPALRPALARPETSESDAVAEVRPRTAVRPGQRATISLTVRNSESRPVHLVPEATDLIGSRSGRIASSRLECTPSQLTLQPQEQADVTIATLVPAETAPGCYAGLLVVRGVEYLRALIVIEVG